MSLYQQIYREHYIGAQYWSADGENCIRIRVVKNGVELSINPLKIDTITEHFHSFSNIWWLHNWMQGYFDGDDFRVRIDCYMIKSLLNDCYEVLADNDKAKELFQLSSEYPFDNATEYNKEFFDNIKEVVAVFERMQQYDDSVEFIYVSY